MAAKKERLVTVVGLLCLGKKNTNIRVLCRILFINLPPRFSIVFLLLYRFQRFNNISVVLSSIIYLFLNAKEG